MSEKSDKSSFYPLLNKTLANIPTSRVVGESFGPTTLITGCAGRSSLLKSRGLHPYLPLLIYGCSYTIVVLFSPVTLPSQCQYCSRLHGYSSRGMLWVGWHSSSCRAGRHGGGCSAAPPETARRPLSGAQSLHCWRHASASTKASGSPEVLKRCCHRSPCRSQEPQVKL